MMVWVINPRWRSVTVYRSATNIKTLTADDELSGETSSPASAAEWGRCSAVSLRAVYGRVVASQGRCEVRSANKHVCPPFTPPEGESEPRLPHPPRRAKIGVG